MTRERRALDYAIEVLRQKYVMVRALGPATEFQEEAAEQLEALRLAADVLDRPYYAVSPFI